MALSALAVCFVAGAIGLWRLPKGLSNNVAFTNISNGSSVAPVQIISGIGWEPSLNNYLVVEPLDASDRKLIQGQITSRKWNLSAHFGNTGTPSGSRFDVYVISSPSKLSVNEPGPGEVLNVPDDSKVSRRVTVILRK